MTAPTPDYRQNVVPDGFVLCAKCSTPIDKNSALFSESGDMICTRCSMVEQIDVGEGRVVGGLRSAAYGSLPVAILAQVFDPFLIVSFSALMSGFGVLIFLWRNPLYRQKLGRHLVPVIVCGALGGLLGSFHPVIFVLAIAGVAAMAGR